jgi:hypothetical protein
MTCAGNRDSKCIEHATSRFSVDVVRQCRDRKARYESAELTCEGHSPARWRKSARLAAVRRIPCVLAVAAALARLAPGKRTPGCSIMRAIRAATRSPKPGPNAAGSIAKNA